MSEENSFHFAEYARPVASKGRNRRNRLLLILLYVLFAAAYSLVFISISFPHPIAILPLFIWMLVFFTWGTVSFEYSVKVDGGTVIFSKVRGKKQKPLYSLSVKSITTAAPLKGAFANGYGDGKVLDFQADPDGENTYYLIHENEGVRTVVLFQTSVQVASAMRYYNKNVVVDKSYLTF